MSKPTEGNIKGAQTHAEGQHGKKSLDKLQEQNASGGGDAETADHGASKREANDPNSAGKLAAQAAQPHENELAHGAEGHSGKHRMVEGRQQHDEADKNQDKNRLIKDIQRHGHDKEQFQVPGGTENHPKSGESKH
jgi:hypothetical protein